jgi:hypothetical protein
MELGWEEISRERDVGLNTNIPTGEIREQMK